MDCSVTIGKLTTRSILHIDLKSAGRINESGSLELGGQIIEWKDV